MIVAATTECYRELPLPDVFEKLLDLEYSAVEIAIDEESDYLKPSDVVANMEKAVTLCRNTHRLDITGYALNITAKGEEHYEQFAACCKLAKATKVATLTVPSAELGTPFNEEVEHLRRLVSIATLESACVSMRSQIGRLTEDPDTVVVLCDNVKGLGVTLDPSHYICGPHAGRSYDKLMKYTYNMYLRDTSKDKLQVRIGQGEVDYGRLINLLRKENYDRALTVDLARLPDLDHDAEMRKLRLLLESLL
ncbi:MAG: sugar phosphate isomerase/epimerase [Planctomycetales bacterium]|nr:sugar phosphate isomerase/epimerase [Planctomycetales bacterium]